jgi:hypothetical protein
MKKYEYKITLPYKVERCIFCPFRHEGVTFEQMVSSDKLSGATGVQRKVSKCVLKGDEIIFMDEQVDGYGSNCPLKGKLNLIEEE